MRKLALGAPPTDGTTDEKLDWCIAALMTIQTASNDVDALRVADTYKPENVTATRTLNVSTATLTDVANVLGTFLRDCKRRGATRT